MDRRRHTRKKHVEDEYLKMGRPHTNVGGIGASIAAAQKEE